MNPNFDTLLKSLANMSTDQLNESARRLARAEKQYTAELICHLVEIMDRKVYLELGYANIFDYCVNRLGFSEAATQLRRQVAGAARRFPQLLEAIVQLCISLSVAAKIAPHLTDGNVDSMLADCVGMTLRRATEYVVALAPKPVVQPGIRRRPQPVRVQNQDVHADVPRQEQANDSAGPARSDEPVASSTSDHPARVRTASHDAPTSLESRAGCCNRPVAPNRPSRTARLEPARPDVFNFRFAAGSRFRDALVRFAEVTDMHPERDMAALLERAVECALDKSDPQRRHERRIARRRVRQATCKSRASGSNATPPHRSNDVATASNGQRAAESKPSQSARIDQTATRGQAPITRPHLPAAVRGRILARAGQRCEYRGPDGRRCTCRTGLQIEHDPPFAVSGSHNEAQLKAFCGRHNQLAAERFFGKAFIDRKIAQRSAIGRDARPKEQSRGSSAPTSAN